MSIFTSKNPSTQQGKRGRLRKKEKKKERKNLLITVTDDSENLLMIQLAKEG
jgi:hypothetical protein